MHWNTANILFADVKGYSVLSDEQMRNFAHHVMEELSVRLRNIEIKEKNTWGDGIVVICEKIEDLCEAALVMKETFQSFNWKKIGLPRLDIRISIHHGQYLEGGDPFTGRGTFCGRSVVMAARIEPVTPPGKIWMTAPAVAMLNGVLNGDDGDLFAIDHVGDITLPKKYGKMDISTLRRVSDPKLSADELAKIREADSMRLERDNEDSQREEAKGFGVVVGVVIDGGKVLLVKRNDNSEGLVWMFPSGKKWPTADEMSVIEKEVMQETGIICGTVEKIARVEKHPLTGFTCTYYSLAPNDEVEPWNEDPLENAEVEWVPIPEAIGRIGTSINSEVRAFLLKHV